jgi:hypothetical protein
MEQCLVPGVEVEHAGQRWRVHRPLGPDAVLLRNEAGEIASVDPVRVTTTLRVPCDPPHTAAGDRQYTDAQWAKAGRRHDRLTGLARLPARTVRDVDATARELGLKRRRVWALLRLAENGHCDVRHLLPRTGGHRAKRLDRTVDALITQAVKQHYAKASRPGLASLHRDVGERCRLAGLTAPCYEAASRLRRHAAICHAVPRYPARQGSGEA